MQALSVFESIRGCRLLRNTRDADRKIGGPRYLLSRVSMGDSPRATAQDYRWALGPELSRGRTNFNVGAGSPSTLYFWRGNAHWWEREKQHQ